MYNNMYNLHCFNLYCRIFLFTCLLGSCSVVSDKLKEISFSAAYLSFPDDILTTVSRIVLILYVYTHPLGCADVPFRIHDL